MGRRLTAFDSTRFENKKRILTSALENILEGEVDA